MAQGNRSRLPVVAHYSSRVARHDASKAHARTPDGQPHGIAGEHNKDKEDDIVYLSRPSTGRGASGRKKVLAVSGSPSSKSRTQLPATCTRTAAGTIFRQMNTYPKRIEPNVVLRYYREQLRICMNEGRATHQAVLLVAPVPLAGGGDPDSGRRGRGVDYSDSPSPQDVDFGPTVVTEPRGFLCGAAHHRALPSEERGANPPN